MRNGSNRFLTSIFVGVCVGLVLSIGSLHLAKVQRDAVAAIDIAQTQVADAETALAAQSSKAASVSGLQKEVADLKKKLAASEARAVSVKRTHEAAAEARKAADAKQKQAAAARSLDRHSPWQPSEERDKTDPILAAFLRKVAINNEVFASLSNKNYAMPGGMLDTWMEGVKRSGVKNAMVIALDDETRQNAEARGLPSHQMHIEVAKAQAGSGDNHAVSAMKFRVLQKFLRLGYSVFLSDVDICVFDNPFKHLERDSDIEGMSDGFSNDTAYGYNDVLDDASMGWARYAHSMRVFVFNSGLFYIRPTAAALELLERVVQVLFKQVRHKPSLAAFRPVTVHVNYHPNKHERMLAIVDRYVNGNLHALDPFPGGSEPGT